MTSSAIFTILDTDYLPITVDQPVQHVSKDGKKWLMEEDCYYDICDYVGSRYGDDKTISSLLNWSGQTMCVGMDSSFTDATILDYGIAYVDGGILKVLDLYHCTLSYPFGMSMQTEYVFETNESLCIHSFGAATAKCVSRCQKYMSPGRQPFYCPETNCSVNQYYDLSNSCRDTTRSYCDYYIHESPLKDRVCVDYQEITSPPVQSTPQNGLLNGVYYFGGQAVGVREEAAVTPTQNLCNPNRINPSFTADISENLFEGCVYLVRVDVEEGVTQIGSEAFKDCDSLASLFLNSDVLTYIGVSAFENTALEQLVVPKLRSLSIRDRAFFNTKIEYLDLGTTAYLGESVFASTPNLNNASTIYAFNGSNIFDNSGLTQLELYLQAGLTDFLSGSSIIELIFQDFNTVPQTLQLATLKTLELNSKHVKIDSPVQTLTLGDHPDSVCQGCSDLNQLNIMSSYVGNSAFEGTSSLKKVNLSNVSVIGSAAFANSALEIVIFSKNQKATVNNTAFLNNVINTISISYCTNMKATICNKDAFPGSFFNNCKTSVDPDQRCRVCPSNQFNTGVGCQNCTKFCQEGEYLEFECSQTADLICSPCPFGTYQPSKQHLDKSCIISSCPGVTPISSGCTKKHFNLYYLLYALFLYYPLCITIRLKTRTSLGSASSVDSQPLLKEMDDFTGK